MTIQLAEKEMQSLLELGWYILQSDKFKIGDQVTFTFGQINVVCKVKSTSGLQVEFESTTIFV
jgi:hypothetical protein